jgi:hypothetical protein
VERRVLQALKANEVLTVLPTDKGNATVALDPADYNPKITALPGGPSLQKVEGPY